MIGAIVWSPPYRGWTSPVAAKASSESEVELGFQVGQLLVSGVAGDELDEVTRQALRRGELAGIIIMPRNIAGKHQLAQLCRSVYLAVPTSDPPPIICVEQEGGVVSRLATVGVPDWGSAKYLTNLGEAGMQDYAKKVGEFMATVYANVDLAPVLDVATNMDSPLIGVRSYGRDPAIVGKLGLAAIDGLRAAGIEPVAKHFPGIGAASTETRRVEVSDADLRATHLPPFVAAFEQGLGALLLANTVYPSLDKSAPASRSRRVATDLLRNELHFAGVTIADASGLVGRDENVSVEDASVQALAAGADLLIDRRSYDNVRATLVELRRAAADGRVSREALKASADRVRAWRLKLRDPRRQRKLEVESGA
jgi:beta-N-acetylhexosaminidase